LCQQRLSIDTVDARHVGSVNDCNTKEQKTGGGFHGIPPPSEYAADRQFGCKKKGATDSEGMATDLDRRSFLGATGASLTSVAIPAFSSTKKNADALILLWIPGGMAATETFDPKEFTPCQRGMDARRVLSTAPSIETSIPGTRISRGLENIAGILDRGTLIRSFVPGDLGPLSHARYQQRWLELSATAGTPHITRCNFASGCAEAVELATRGARSILVPFAFTPFTHWDTHDDGHARMEILKKEIDAPVANLILELERRGLLERTLVVLASEFSRSPDVDGTPILRDEKQYGLHAHFGGSASVLIFGGGTERGRVIGRTANVHPAVVIENPLSFSALAQNYFCAMENKCGW
jgi:hypothetical protein